MKRIILTILTILMLLPATAGDVQVGNKMKPDKHIQDKALATGEQFPYQVGDTIVIPRSQTHYLSGERMHVWVYYVAHVIGQIGSERYPNGIFLRGINSWVRADGDGLLMYGAVERSDAEQEALVRARLKDDKEALEAREEAWNELSESEQQEVKEQAQQSGAAVLHEAVEVTTPQEEVTMPQEEVVAPREQESENVAVPEKRDEEIASVEEKEEEKESIESIAEDEPREVAIDGTDEAVVEKARAMQMDRLSIGVRGGAASLMQDVNRRIGWDALLDIQYAHYWYKNEQTPRLGVIVGLAGGYMRNAIWTDVYMQESVVADGMDLRYTVRADRLDEQVAQWQVEVPVLFSLLTQGGFYLNAGPKVVLPVRTSYSRTISNPRVEVYMPQIDVTFVDDVVMGRVTPEQAAKEQGEGNHTFVPTIAGMLDMGYEVGLRSGNALSIGVYADYGYSLYSKSTVGLAPLVGVTPPSATANAQISMGPLHRQVTKMGLWDAGLKLTYHIQFKNAVQR